MRIRCNVVSPGLVRSEIHYTTGMGREEHRKYLTDRGPGHPLGRTGEPDDISGVGLLPRLERIAMDDRRGDPDRRRHLRRRRLSAPAAAHPR